MLGHFFKENNKLNNFKQKNLESILKNFQNKNCKTDKVIEIHRVKNLSKEEFF